MKNLTLKKGKLTELLTNGLVFVSVEEKADYNDKSVILHNATVLSPDCNETIIVSCRESLPKDIKPMDKVDFIDCEVLLRGKGTTVFGANIMAELTMTTNAQKMVKAV